MMNHWENVNVKEIVHLRIIKYFNQQKELLAGPTNRKDKDVL